MEPYYIKQGRKYVKVGYSYPDLPVGLYWTQENPYGRRSTCVHYWAGSNPPQPLNIERLISIMQNDDSLAKYISGLCNPDSPELAKAIADKNSRGPLTLGGFSPYDLAQCILRFMFETSEKTK